MQTLEMPKTATAVSRLNPSYYLTAFVVGGSLMVWQTSSTKLAIGWILGVLALWILFETLAVTLFLHRLLTHGAFAIRAKWYTRFWLWWSRSGMAKYWEWVENHAAHHALTDTPHDSYTPHEYMVNIDQPPLTAPRPWQFWHNAVAYTRTSRYYRHNPERLQQLAEEHAEVRRALDRLDELSWAREDYGKTNRGMWLNLALFAVACMPLVFGVGAWWLMPLLVIVPWMMLGIKASLYVYGGYVINYYGHQAEGEVHQSNIPWWLMLVTFFVMGEGWHRFHHDAPFAARFNRVLDPGWWVVWASAKLKLVGNITVAKRIAPRRYAPRSL